MQTGKLYKQPRWNESDAAVKGLLTLPSKMAEVNVSACTVQIA